MDCILFLNLRRDSQSQSELLRMHTNKASINHSIYYVVVTEEYMKTKVDSETLIICFYFCLPIWKVSKGFFGTTQWQNVNIYIFKRAKGYIFVRWFYIATKTAHAFTQRWLIQHKQLQRVQLGMKGPSGCKGLGLLPLVLIVSQK